MPVSRGFRTGSLPCPEGSSRECLFSGVSGRCNGMSGQVRY
jgi:hypothetical protein